VKRLDDVTPELVDRFVTTRSRVAAHATVRKDCALLAGAWSRAVKLRTLGENPWKAVTVPGKAKRRKSSFTPEQYRALLGVCRPWLRDLVTLGVNTGLRVTALTRLEWRDVRWNRGDGPGLGSVVVRPELDKAKAGYEVPMSQDCHDLLARLSPGKGAHPFVLSGQGGKPINSVRAVVCAIHMACKRAGLPKPDSPCHAMRRTFGRWAVLGALAGRPVPLYVVSRWMGHHGVKQTEQYLDLSDEASQEWMTGEAQPPG
jgi:integrase